MDYSRGDVFRQIAKDKKLKDEILEKISNSPSIGADLLEPTLAEFPMGSAGIKGIQVVSADQKVGDAARILETPNPEIIPDDLAIEAIVLRLGRPVLKVINDDFDVDEAETEEWKNRLKKYRNALKQILPSVGRVEVDNNPRYSWVGTGWVVAEDIIVTNRHVANAFAKTGGQRFTFRANLFGVPMKARLDFREEFQTAKPAEYEIREILHIEDEDGPDIAFLRIAWESGSLPDRRAIVPLADEIKKNDYVAAIGYPAKDTRTNIPAEMDAIFANIYDVKRLAPGQIMALVKEHGSFAHDCTTLGGNSGSAVIKMETGEAAGLHFAGREGYANYAVSAPVVLERLQALTRRRSPARRRSISLDAVEIAEAPSLAEMGGRKGFDPDFLGKPVPLPMLRGELVRRVAPVSGNADGILNYAHYSVIMHANRRFAIYTAVNIDGKLWRHIPRAGSDKWYFDPRLDTSYQAGNEIYTGNRLDRGHLVRRMDPAWGKSYKEAVQAEKDTFFYTNCAPQHDQMNRKTWLGLEDYILENANAQNMKVVAFNGPVFRDTDRPYRGIRIPEDFWKVVAVVNTDTKELSATAYLLTQLDMLDNLEFAFGAYKTYQVPVSQIESLTNLDFGDLTNFDPLAEIEAFSANIPIDTYEAIQL